MSLEQPLIRPFGHLLPDGEGKELTYSFFQKKIELTNEIKSLKTLARLGEGGPSQTVGEGRNRCG